MDAAVKFPVSPRAVKAAPLKLSRRMDAEQAFEAIARGCIEQVRANEAGAGRFHDRESLHQMRVGLRRLRAALAMFGDVLQAPEPIQSGLRWLMDQLAPARDWDVLLASTLPQVEGALAEPAALARLRAATQARLNALHARAADAVASPRYQALMDTLDAWLEQRAWREHLSAKGKMRLKLRAADVAGGILEQERERLLKRGAKLKLKHATSEERHRARIAAKRTRYAAEFFASLFPGKRVRPYVAALRVLQRELGALNDAHVGRRLLGELCDGDDTLREEAALVRGYLAAASARSAPRLRRRWKTLAPMKTPN